MWSLLNLEIGAGTKAVDGWISLDNSPFVESDLKADLESGLPFRADTFNEIKAIHTLEYIEHLIPLMNDCWDCLKVKGSMVICTPVWPSSDMFVDPTHKRFFTIGTFEYWSIDHARHKEYGKIYGIKPWRIVDGPYRGDDKGHVEMSIRMMPVKDGGVANAVQSN